MTSPREPPLQSLRDFSSVATLALADGIGNAAA